MQTVHTIAELRSQLAAWRAAGDRIALVPTMGNLHAGHMQLVQQAAQHGQRVVASVFVNPLQFGANEDFGRYPRTLPQDAEQLAAHGCHLLFAPTVSTMYPHGLPISTSVEVTQVTETLEGAFRPGHFSGVATVVNVLLNLFQPDAALFGQKDYQQLAVIRRMVRDLHLPIEIIGVPTVRAADGLALSSRNQYLSAEQRHTATVIYGVLKTIEAEVMGGSRNFAGLEEAGLQALQAHGFNPQYVAIRDLDLSPANPNGPQWVVLIAAYLGSTRLIDNLLVGQP